MSRRRPPSSASPRPFPIDIAVVVFLAAVLWSAWPSVSERRPDLSRTHAPRPSVAFVKADLATFARGILDDAPLQAFRGRSRAPRPTALPSWGDVVPVVPPPAPTPLAPPVPATPPLRMPAPPEPRPETTSGLTALPQPTEMPPWDLALPDTLLDAGVSFDNDALRAASTQAAPSGDCSADIVFGDDGLPETVLLDPDAAATFSAESRLAMVRALLRARVPVRAAGDGAARLAGRLRWRWKPPAEAEDADAAAARTEPLP